MSKHLNWDIYTKQIREQIESEREDASDNLFDSIKDFIDEQVFYSLDKMNALIDREAEIFKLRLAFESMADKNDNRNILFSIDEELEDEDDLCRVRKLKSIFINSLKIIEYRILELEKEEIEESDEQ